MKCEPVVFSLGEKKRWSRELWFLVCLSIQMQVYHSELHLCDCRDMWDLHSVFWAKFGGNCGQRLCWRASGQYSTLLLPPSQLWFLHLTCCVVLAFFRGFLLQQCSWKAEFVIREYSRAIDFAFLNKKSGVTEFFVRLIERVDFQSSCRTALCLW